MDWSWTTNLKDLLWAVGIVGGGAWALYRFGVARDHTAHLQLDWSAEFDPATPTLTTVFLKVRLENRGKTMLSAKPTSTKEDGARGPAYCDHNDSLEHACGLQIRSLPPQTVPGHVSWYVLAPMPELPEVNLLEEFETGTDGVVDFHLEPGEASEITVPVNLTNGSYLAKLHFVGTERMNYWSRVFWLRVPSSTALPTAPQAVAPGESR